MRWPILATVILLVAVRASAETPASAVTTTPVVPGAGAASLWPEVSAGGEGWFNIGGYCKVVDVSSLTNLSGTDRGAPVWIDGGAQWEDYRTNAGSKFSGDVVLTSCCPPLAAVPGANLCTEAGAAVKTVSRAYGKNGEVDTVTATCVDQWGDTYTDSINVQCAGSDAPDGTAQWVVAGSDTPSGCTSGAYDTGCYAACDSYSSGTRYDSCGNPTGYSCYGGACPPPPPPPDPPGVPACTPVHYCCGDGSCWTDCSGGDGCSNAGLGACVPNADGSGCGGSTWTTVPSCNACECGELMPTGAWVPSGPGCCTGQGTCFDGS